MDLINFSSSLDEPSILWTTNFHPSGMNCPLYGLNKIFIEKIYQSYLNIPRIIKQKVVLKA